MKTLEQKVEQFKRLQEKVLSLREEITGFRKDVVKTVNDTIKYFQTISPFDKESVFCVYLDAKNKIMDYKTISEGTLSQSLLYPREIIKQALNIGALSIIVMHNHPSGEFTPSENDKKITKRLLFACRNMDIMLLDHIITGSTQKYYSFYEEGLIDRYRESFRYVMENEKEEN
jgi:DNA repair protein RadC